MMERLEGNLQGYYRLKKSQMLEKGTFKQYCFTGEEYLPGQAQQDR